MATDHRKACFQSHGQECFACSSADDVQVHHLDGDRNNNDLDNLIPLCRQCHTKLHSKGLDGLEKLLKPVSERSHIDPQKTSFQFQIDDEKWRQWKNTVPREKSLEKRIIELIEADTEGRVQENEDGG